MPESVTQWQNYRGIDNRFASQVAPASQFEEPDGVQWADYGKAILGGGASLVQATGWLANVLGAEDVGTSIEELGSEAVDFWNDSMSEPAKSELSKQVIRKNDEGEYEWGDPSFATIGLMGAQSLLGTAAGMGAGAGLTKVLQVFANPFGRGVLTNAVKAGSAEGATAKAVAEGIAAGKKMKLVDRVLGATGFGLGEGSIGGISAGASVYDNVMNMDPEKLLANDRYQQIYESTDNSISELERHQYAADTLAKEASTSAGWQSGLTTALLGAPMGAYFGRILGGAKLSSSLPRALATGALGEASQEFAQSGVEQYISNIQTGKIDPDVDPFDDVLNAAVSGGLAGGLLGGIVGPAAVKGSRAEVQSDKAEAALEDDARLRKIGKPLQDAGRKTMKAVNAAKQQAKDNGTEPLSIEKEHLDAIVEDWRQEKISMSQALDNMAALEREALTGETATTDRPVPKVSQQELDRMASAPGATVSKAEPRMVQQELGGEIEQEVPEVPAARQEEAPAETPMPEQADEALMKAAGGPVSVESVDPTALQVDAARFQFKAQTDTEGVSKALKGVKQFEQYKAGLAIVWESKTGERFIVDGHQRVALAKRAVEAGQDPAEVRMAAYVVREVDGVTPEQATNMAALKNMGEGTGSAVDAAKVMREMGPAGEEAIANLPPNSALVQQSKGLAKLDDEAFGKAVNEVIDPRYAAVVGEMISDGGLQNAAIDVLRQTEPANATQARAIVDQVRTTGSEETVTEDLFGEQTVTESLYLERAKVLDAAFRAARRDKATFRTLTSKESTITGAGKNKLDRAANEAKVSDANMALTALSTAANTKGPVSDALTEAARRVKAGEKPAAVAKDFLSQAVASITGRSSDGKKAGRRKQASAKASKRKAATGQLAAEGLYSRGVETVGNNYGASLTASEFIEQHGKGKAFQEAIESGNNLGMRQYITARGFTRVSRAFADEVMQSAQRREALVKEEARRDRIRNTGQLALFSRSGKPLSDIRIMREFEVEETGEMVEVEQNAEVIVRWLDKRRNVVQRLRECVGG